MSYNEFGTLEYVNLGTKVNIYRRGKFRLLILLDSSITNGLSSIPLSSNDKPAVNSYHACGLVVNNEFYNGHIILTANDTRIQVRVAQLSPALPSSGTIRGSAVYFTA